MDRFPAVRWNEGTECGVITGMTGCTSPASGRCPPYFLAVFLFVPAAAVFVSGQQSPPPAKPTLSARTELTAALVAAALDRPNHPAKYEAKYVAIPYPNGDVPPDTGVCADEIVRIYRAAGIDLQQRVHEDMVAAWNDYPHKWGA